MITHPGTRITVVLCELVSANTLGDERIKRKTNEIRCYHSERSLTKRNKQTNLCEQQLMSDGALLVIR